MTDPHADEPPATTGQIAANAQNMPPGDIHDVTSFNENTLSKVLAGLRAANISDEAATDAILEMQNRGILFRENPIDTGKATDGYHSFKELYAHREALTAVLATIAAIDDDSWRSRQHHPDDAPMFDGYFIVGINLPAGQISYHQPLSHWHLFDAVPELGHAPKYDGHTSADVVARLHDFADVLKTAINEGNATLRGTDESAGTDE